MRGISTRARQFIRVRAEENMTAECLIERVSAPAFDETTSLMTAGSRTLIYTGKCRIWEVHGSSPLALGDDEVVLQATQLSIPWDSTPVPHRDDEVLLTSSLTDAALAGKRFRILDYAKGGELRPTRRFSVQGIQEES